MTHRPVPTLLAALALTACSSPGATVTDGVLGPLIDPAPATADDALVNVSDTNFVVNALVGDVVGLADGLAVGLEGRTVQVDFADGHVVESSNLCGLLGEAAVGGTVVNLQLMSLFGLDASYADLDPLAVWPQQGSTCTDPVDGSPLLLMSALVADLHDRLGGFTAASHTPLQVAMDAACDDVTLCPGIDIWIYQPHQLQFTVDSLTMEPDPANDEVDLQLVVTDVAYDFAMFLDLGILVSSEVIDFTVQADALSLNLAAVFGQETMIIGSKSESNASVGIVNRGLDVLGLGSPTVLQISIIDHPVMTVDIGEKLAGVEPAVQAAIDAELTQGLRIWPTSQPVAVLGDHCLQCDEPGRYRCDEVSFGFDGFASNVCVREPFANLKGDPGVFAEVEWRCGDANDAISAFDECTTPDCSECTETIRPNFVVAADFDDDHWHHSDLCPLVADSSNADADSDGSGDACDPCPFDVGLDDSSDDDDGVCTSDDNCPGLSNADQSDSDGDGLGDACDLCPGQLNSYNNVDLDGDGLAAPCDDDDDDDGVLDEDDNCPTSANANQSDVDGDGQGDACEPCFGAQWSNPECYDLPREFPEWQRWEQVPFDPVGWDSRRVETFADPTRNAALFTVERADCAGRACGLLTGWEVEPGARSQRVLDVDRGIAVDMAFATGERVPDWIHLDGVSWTRTGATVTVTAEPPSGTRSVDVEGEFLISDGVRTYTIPLEVSEPAQRAGR